MEQNDQEERCCPRCLEFYTGHPAISREDNQTEICPACGLEQAIEAWTQAKSKPDDTSPNV